MARSILSLDLRSLALFRIAIGTCLLLNLVTLVPEIGDFYTDRGIMPREAMVTLGDPWEASVHLMSGQWTPQLLLFLLAIVFAIGLTVGYRTRLCTVASWALLTSLHARNPLVIHYGDDVLRVLLFWSMFVPLNGRYSLDQALNASEPKLPANHMSWGSQALMLQLCFVYWFTAALKWHPAWLGEGSAVYYALSMDLIATPMGRFLLQYPDLLRVVTRATVALELLGPFLVFSPVWNGPLRMLVVLTFIGFHLALGLSMYLGIFSWVCAAAWLMFVPPGVWDRVESRARSRSQGLGIYFDARCGFCRRAVLVLRELLLLQGAQVREAQSDPEVEALMLARNSWIVRTSDGEAHFGYDAFVVLCRQSVLTSPLVPALATAPARRVGDRIYRWVAGNRPRMSRIMESLTPPPPREHRGWISNTIVLLFSLLVLASNVSNHSSWNVRIPSVGSRLLSVTQMAQNWAMFAPFPRVDDGWYVMEGVTRNGARADLWNGEGSPTETKPSDVASTYQDPQWRAFLVRIWLARNSGYRSYFGHYLCRRWNAAHPSDARVTRATLSYVLETTPAPGSPQSPLQVVQLWQGECMEND